MSIKTYTEKMKIIYDGFIDFLDNEDSIEEEFIYFNTILEKQNIKENPNDLRLFLHLLVNVSNNHHRKINFYKEIEKILISFKYELKRFYSNTRLYNIFKSNKKLLLFIINEKLIIDYYILKNMIKGKYYVYNYPQYFAPEIKHFVNENFHSSRIYFNALKNIINKDLPADFEENRLQGENEKKICEMIRDDKIIDFITYVNKTNYSLKSHISPSIYETNSFLIKKQVKKTKYMIQNDEEENPTLIEYATFLWINSNF